MTYKCIGPKQFASGQKLTCIPFVFSAGCHAAPYVPLLLVGIQNLPNLLVENSVVPVKALGKVFVNGGLGDTKMFGGGADSCTCFDHVHSQFAGSVFDGI